MNSTSPFVAFALSLAALPLAAQTATPPASKPAAPHAATAPAAARGGCFKLPEISAKVPAVPAGLSCAKALYTISSVPSVKLDYVSPLEGHGLRETLGLESASFTLAYIDTKIGSGPLAAPHKWYSINYTGYLTDGTKFDSSLDHGGEPISIPYGQHGVIPGWDTGFDGMHIGGKRRLFIPYQLAYGTKGSPPVIPAKAELIFDVELLSQSDTKPVPKTPPTPLPAPATVPSSPTSPGSPTAPSSATPPSSTPAPAASPAPVNPAQPSTPPPGSVPETTPTPSPAPKQ